MEVMVEEREGEKSWRRGRERRVGGWRVRIVKKRDDKEEIIRG